VKTIHVRHKTSRGPRSKVFPNVSRSEVAKHLKITRSHVSKILSGTVTPSVDVLERMANLFQMSMEELNRQIQISQPKHAKTFD